MSLCCFNSRRSLYFFIIYWIYLNYNIMPAIGIGVGVGFNNQNIKDRMPDIKYLFVDGGYLDRVLCKVSQDFFGSKTPVPIDYSKAFGGYNKVFYYHSLPSKREKERDEDFEIRLQKKKDLFDELRLLPNIHVFEGLTSGKGKSARQKGVDIMIAVDMLRHSFRGNMNKATLLTGDLDFKPLLDALIWEGMFTSVLYSKVSYSKQLLSSADTVQRISIRNIYHWLLDEQKPNYPIPEQINNFKMAETELIEEGVINNDKYEIYEYGDSVYFLIILSKVFASKWTHFDLKKLKIFIEDQYNAKLIEK